MRVFLAVFTGYMVFAVSAVLLFQLTQQDPHATPTLLFGVGSTVWGIVSAALGGYVAARIPHQPTLLPSILVGGVIAAGALVSLIAEWGSGSMWSQLCAVLLMAPAACLGGLLSRRKSNAVQG